MSKKIEYHGGRLVSFTKLVVDLVKKNPTLLDNFDLLKASIKSSLPPEMKDPSSCANCGASMKEWIYVFDCWDALLLLRMAEVVRDRVRKGLDFTVANQARIPELNATHAVKCRTTQTAKLGLIAQLRSKQTGGRVPGVWVITRRGFEALGGKPVPKKVRVWRKKIEERFDGEVTTIADALETHVGYVTEALRKGRNVKEDHRAFIAEYNPTDWHEFGIHQGAIELV